MVEQLLALMADQLLVPMENHYLLLPMEDQSLAPMDVQLLVVMVVQLQLALMVKLLLTLMEDLFLLLLVLRKIDQEMEASMVANILLIMVEINQALDHKMKVHKTVPKMDLALDPALATWTMAYQAQALAFVVSAKRAAQRIVARKIVP
jgi:hypothetical protein